MKDCINGGADQLDEFARIHEIQLSKKDYCDCVTRFWATKTRDDRSLSQRCVCNQLKEESSSFQPICQDPNKFADKINFYEISPVVIYNVRISRISIHSYFRRMVSKPIDDSLIVDFIKGLSGQVITPTDSGEEGSIAFNSDFNFKNEKYNIAWFIEGDEIKVVGIREKTDGTLEK